MKNSRAQTSKHFWQCETAPFLALPSHDRLLWYSMQNPELRSKRRGLGSRIAEQDFGLLSVLRIQRITAIPCHIRLLVHHRGYFRLANNRYLRCI